MKFIGKMKYKASLDVIREQADKRRVSLPEFIKLAIVKAGKVRGMASIKITKISLDCAEYEYEVGG